MASQSLYAEHRVIRGLLAGLERLCAARDAGQRVPDELFAEVITLLREFAGGIHRAKKEQHLYPLLMRRGFPCSTGPIARTMREHAELSRWLESMERSLGSDPDALADAARHYALLFRQHLSHEENFLLPTADRLFTPEEQRALSEGYAAVDRDAAAAALRASSTDLLACLSAIDRAPD